MDAKSPFENLNYSYNKDGLAFELVDWFSVSGDMDDFIFYDDRSDFEAE